MRTAVLLIVAVGLVTLVSSQNTACTNNADCDKSCGANMVGHCENNMCHCHAHVECVHADDCTCGGNQIATCDNHQCHCHHHRRAEQISTLHECYHSPDCTCGGGHIATCEGHKCHCHHP